jgi:HD superfamily phosphodiesterase
LAALLHDIADHKYNDGDFQKGEKVAYELLMSNGASEELAIEVSKVIYPN